MQYKKIMFFMVASFYMSYADAMQVCYPGTLASGEICFPVGAISDIHEDGYEYADPYADASFPGNFNPAQYRAPVRLIDLQNLNGNSYLVPKFQLKEIMTLEKGRYGIFSPRVLQIIETMREKLGKPITMNSAYRNPGFNGGVGGVKWSRHIYGDGIDIDSSTASLNELRDACLAAGTSYYQMYAAHVHCDWRSVPLEKAFFGAGSLDVEQDPNITFYAINSYYERTLKVRAEVRGGRIQFQSDQPFHEDEGEDLLMDWIITLPDGGHLESQAQRPDLPYVPGEYRVRVTIGGSLTLPEQTLRIQ